MGGGASSPAAVAHTRSMRPIARASSALMKRSRSIDVSASELKSLCYGTAEDNEGTDVGERLTCVLRVEGDQLLLLPHDLFRVDLDVSRGALHMTSTSLD